MMLCGETRPGCLLADVPGVGCFSCVEKIKPEDLGEQGTKESTNWTVIAEVVVVFYTTLCHAALFLISEYAVTCCGKPENF